MMFTFDLQDQECVECLVKLDELHAGASRELGKFKGKAGMFDFNADNPGGMFKNPVYYKRDLVSGERVKGRNPSMWVKMNNWTNNKTLFTDLNGNSINWELLYDVEVSMIPLVHVEKIYIGGGKGSLQMKMISGVVTSVVRINTQSRQTRTIQRLKEKHSGLADTVAEQLAQLTMDKQDMLDSHSPQPQDGSGGQNSSGQMHQIPSSSGKFQSDSKQLNDFLRGAPTQTNPPVQSSQPVQLHVQSNPPVQSQDNSQNPSQFPAQQVHLPPQPVLQALPPSALSTQHAQPVQFSQTQTTQGGQAMLQIQ